MSWINMLSRNSFHISWGRASEYDHPVSTFECKKVYQCNVGRYMPGEGSESFFFVVEGIKIKTIEVVVSFSWKNSKVSHYFIPEHHHCRTKKVVILTQAIQFSGKEWKCLILLSNNTIIVRQQKVFILMKQNTIIIVMLFWRNEHSQNHTIPLLQRLGWKASKKALQSLDRPTYLFFLDGTRQRGGGVHHQDSFCLLHRSYHHLFGNIHPVK